MENEVSKTKFCKHCGEKIDSAAILCVKCGKQVENFSNSTQPSIIINNANTNTNANATIPLRAKNKWVALCLCLFLGFFGAHKFYEGKAGSGVLYLFTIGLFGIGVIIDFITILCKPNPYYI